MWDNFTDTAASIANVDNRDNSLSWDEIRYICPMYNCILPSCPGKLS